MLPDIFHDGPGDGGLGVVVTSEQFARWQAIRQIGRRRRFRFQATMGLLGVPQRGGWPGHGFSRSSWPPVPNVWDDWMIWAATVRVLATAGYAWFVSEHERGLESEIKREMEREAGRRADRWRNWRCVARRRRCGHEHGECSRAGGPAGEGF